jgi:predicted DNA-binding transcriptional regulator YafY
MRDESFQTLQRQWTMLRAIPRLPQKITVTALMSVLLDAGFRPSRRTLERDLHEMSTRFPLVVDDRHRPYGWSWLKDAVVEFMPRLTVSQGVALRLAEVHIRNLLPQIMLRDLAPLFDAADTELANTGWKDWHKRTAVVPSTLALLPPKIDAQVLSDVQHAIARRCLLTARYRSKGSTMPKEMTIHPLGLLVRGSIQYLVCTLRDYAEVRQLAVHRMSGTVLGAESCKQPPGFSFSRYVANDLAIASRGKIRLVARFDPTTAEHLRETPLSKDQRLEAIEGSDKIEVTATVEGDQQLRWWLLAFGSQVEVREPGVLRQEMAGEFRAALLAYGD